MPFKINKEVDRREYARHNNAERHYMEQLRGRGLLLEIDNISVDAEQLVLRSFQCDTDYCVRCTGRGAGLQYKGSCCTDLQVDITTCERDKLVELAWLAKRNLKLKNSDPVAKIVDNIIGGKTTEMTEDHELVFRHKKNGACAMSWMEGDRLRCSINTLTAALSLDLREYKPDPCFLFPLHYSEIGRNEYLISVLSEETRGWIEQHQIVGKLRCLRAPQPGSPPAYQFLQGEIEYVVSKGFYRELDRRARPILERFHTEAATNGAGSRGRKPIKAGAAS